MSWETTVVKSTYKEKVSCKCHYMKRILSPNIKFITEKRTPNGRTVGGERERKNDFDHYNKNPEKNDPYSYLLAHIPSYGIPTPCFLAIKYLCLRFSCLLHLHSTVLRAGLSSGIWHIAVLWIFMTPFVQRVGISLWRQEEDDAACV